MAFNEGVMVSGFTYQRFSAQPDARFTNMAHLLGGGHKNGFLAHLLVSFCD